MGLNNSVFSAMTRTIAKHAFVSNLCNQLQTRLATNFTQTGTDAQRIGDEKIRVLQLHSLRSRAAMLRRSAASISRISRFASQSILGSGAKPVFSRSLCASADDSNLGGIRSGHELDVEALKAYLGRDNSLRDCDFSDLTIK